MPDYCGQGICIAAQSPEDEVIEVASKLSRAENSENIQLRFKSGRMLVIHASTRSDCKESTSNENLTLNLLPSPCVLVNLSANGWTRAHLSQIEITIWQIEEVPGGAWKKGPARRMSQSVELCLDKHVFFSKCKK